jgi:hypothetical protein
MASKMPTIQTSPINDSETTPMSREEQLKIWLENKKKTKDKAAHVHVPPPITVRGNRKLNQATFRRNSHQSDNQKVDEQATETRLSDRQGDLVLVERTKSFTTPVEKPFYERLFDKTTISSQLKARNLSSERKSLSHAISTTPNNIPVGARMTPTQPPDGLRDNKRSQTEPKPPRPLAVASSKWKNRRSFSHVKHSVPSAFSSKTPMAKRRTPTLIGREFAVDTKTPPPPLSPMECSVPTEIPEKDVEFEENGENQECVESDEASEGRTELGSCTSKPMEPGEHHLKPCEDIVQNIEFVSEVETSQYSCVVDQILGGSAGSTSSRDSFVNFKRRGRRRRPKRQPLGNCTNTLDGEHTEEFIRSKEKSQQTKGLQQHSQDPTSSATTIADPEFDQEINTSEEERNEELDPKLESPTSKVCNRNSLGSTSRLTNSDDMLSLSDQNAGIKTSIVLDDEYDSENENVASRRRRGRRRASIFCPTSDSVEESGRMAQSVIQEEIGLEKCLGKQQTNKDNIIEETVQDTDDILLHSTNYQTAMHNGKSLLDRIPEDNDIQIIDDMQQQIISLQIDKKKLQDRIFANTKDYEKRITPFRNIFEEVRSHGGCGQRFS